MGIRKIRLDGDPILRKECKVVDKITPRIQTLIEDMLDTMYDANGVGLAAPQVGVLKRVIVIDVQDDNQYVLINPEIVETSGEQTGDEGCLSLPGKVGTVTRPDHVIVKAFNENMEPITVEGEGLLARAICHEVEHLEGILYKDHVTDGLRNIEADPEDE